MTSLSLTPEQRAHQEAMWALLRQALADAGGALRFDRYMHLALYAPGLGYYTGGAVKFGAGGDFVTAPEISPLFGRTLAFTCAEVLEGIGGGDLLEFGAGTGRLAVDLLDQLDRLGRLPARYLVLEPSPELRQRQRRRLSAELPRLAGRVEWIDRLPDAFEGVVLANEVLDAMPVRRFRKGAEGLEEQWVAAEGEGLRALWRPADAVLQAAIADIERDVGILPVGYVSELNPGLAPWVASVAALLRRGLLLVMDYGHPRSVYYHPQRHMGTLVCHHRHRSHEDPFFLPGLQDITAHVDFTALARAGEAAGLTRAGYATQGRFLLSGGLDRLLAETDASDTASHLELAQQVKRLTSPNGMGEVFKVMALGRGLPGPLRAFS